MKPKPKVHCDLAGSEIEPRPKATCIKNLVKFARVVLETCMRAYIQ